MEVIDVVRADQLDGGEQILIIRQVKHAIVRHPLENITVNDFGVAIEVRGYSHIDGDNQTWFLLPDEDVEIWTAGNEID